MTIPSSWTPPPPPKEEVCPPKTGVPAMSASLADRLVSDESFLKESLALGRQLRALLGPELEKLDRQAACSIVAEGGLPEDPIRKIPAGDLPRVLRVFAAAWLAFTLDEGRKG